MKDSRYSLHNIKIEPKQNSKTVPLRLIILRQFILNGDQHLIHHSEMTQTIVIKSGHFSTINVCGL